MKRLSTALLTCMVYGTAAAGDRCDEALNTLRVETQRVGIMQPDTTLGADADREDIARLERSAAMLGTEGRDDACVAAVEQAQVIIRRVARPAAVRSDELLGKTVVDAAGREIGEVEELVVDMNESAVAYALVESGGFLGIGDDLVPVPFSALSLDEDGERLVLKAGPKQLELAPRYSQEDLTGMANRHWSASVHGFYGEPPYWQARNRAGPGGRDAGPQQTAARSSDTLASPDGRDAGASGDEAQAGMRADLAAIKSRLDEVVERLEATDKLGEDVAALRESDRGGERQQMLAMLETLNQQMRELGAQSQRHQQQLSELSQSGGLASTRLQAAPGSTAPSVSGDARIASTTGAGMPAPGAADQPPAAAAALDSAAQGASGAASAKPGDGRQPVAGHLAGGRSTASDAAAPTAGSAAHLTANVATGGRTQAPGAVTAQDLSAATAASPANTQPASSSEQRATGNMARDASQQGASTHHTAAADQRATDNMTRDASAQGASTQHTAAADQQATGNMARDASAQGASTQHTAAADQQATGNMARDASAPGASTQHTAAADQQATGNMARDASAQGASTQHSAAADQRATGNMARDASQPGAPAQSTAAAEQQATGNMTRDASQQASAPHASHSTTANPIASQQAAVQTGAESRQVRSGSTVDAARGPAQGDGTRAIAHTAAAGSEAGGGSGTRNDAAAAPRTGDAPQRSDAAAFTASRDAIGDGSGQVTGPSADELKVVPSETNPVQETRDVGEADAGGKIEMPVGWGDNRDGSSADAMLARDRALGSLFAQLDTDGDGHVSRTEAQANFVIYRHYLTLDANGDDRLDEQEFLATRNMTPRFDSKGALLTLGQSASDAKTN